MNCKIGTALLIFALSILQFWGLLGKAESQPSLKGKLKGSGSIGTLVYQGTSVALSADGNTAIVGATSDNSKIGAAWIYIRSGGVWSQQGNKLVGSAYSGAMVYQGGAVAISADGNTAIVGGYNDNSGAGAVWVFTRTGSTWSQQGAKLVGTGTIGIAQQGTSVALSADGNTALVGGPYDNTYKGATWVFTRSGSTWTQQGNKLIGSQAVSAFQGSAVALSSDGNTAMIGGVSDNGSIGASWVFTRSAGVWRQQGGKLVGSGWVGGGNQGCSVALSSDGNTAVVGAHFDSSARGASWIFTRTDTVWSQQGSQLVGTGASGIAEQGYSVTLSGDGNTAIVGGYRDNGYVGAAWVFVRSGVVWSQRGGKFYGAGASGAAHQGKSVAISSDASTIIVGGPIDSAGIGAAWVYDYSVTGVDESAGTPAVYRLENNYPNPFNPSTTIRYELLRSADVKLVVYDLLGREVAVLVEERQSPGSKSVTLDGGNLPSGVYYYKISAGAFSDVKKMILVK